MKPWQNTLSKLFEDHRRQLVSMANRRIGDRETADEIVQDVYARLMLSGDHGTDEENVKVLYASVRNAVIDHHRSTAGRNGLMSRILPIQLWQKETSSPQEHAQSRQALSALDRALPGAFPQGARDVCPASGGRGFKRKTGAEIRNIVSAVEKQLARTMRHCQQRLEAYRDTD